MGGLENLDPWLSDGLDCTSVVQFLFFSSSIFQDLFAFVHVFSSTCWRTFLGMLTYVPWIVPIHYQWALNVCL